jgi:DNA-binding XRE family transcriptional regulator
MALAPYVAGVNQAAGEGRHSPRGQAEPVPELAGRHAAAQDEVLERGEFDLRSALASRARRALVRASELHPLERLAKPMPWLSYWLCTHWPTSPRMPRVTPEEQFAANLRRHRAAAKLSQEQLAEKAGLHPTEISRLERAVREPRLGTIARLARGLGIGAEQLVAGIR